MNLTASEIITLLRFHADIGIDSICSNELGEFRGLDNIISLFEKKYPTDDSLLISQEINSAPNTSKVGRKLDIKSNFTSSMQDRKTSINKIDKNDQKNEVKNIIDKDILLSVRSDLDKIDNLDKLRNYVANFPHCNLKFGAKNTVFSDGQSNSKVMLIGEAPGEQEDLKGIPFCGRSGALLDNILKSIGLRRDSNIYISNSVFWRPPANRKPTIEEVEICRPILEKHISIIKPLLIIVCGATSMETILKKSGITKMTGHFFDYTNQYLEEPIKVTPIFHPAFLLRSPGKKAVTWEHMCSIRDYCEDKDIHLDSI